MDLALLYSLDPTITRKQLHSDNFNKEVMNISWLGKLTSFIEKHNIKWTIQSDPSYHFKFHQISSKPHIIYYMGNIDILNNTLLGIVWPRIASDYGKKVITDLIREGKKYNLNTISGLAPGIDTHCHDQSLKQWIPTIAVLGGWLQYYLLTRTSLIEKIIWNWWLIISEFKIGFKPTNWSFPQRNRIIAWLSDSLFVPEASEKSGSLITVDFALQGRKPVFASPNDIYNIHSTGINKYISEHKVQAIYNIQFFLQSQFTLAINDNEVCDNKKNIQTEHLDVIGKFIIQELMTEPLSIEQLLYKTWLSIVIITTQISLLETMGYIYQPNTWVYKLC